MNLESTLRSHNLRKKKPYVLFHMKNVANYTQTNVHEETKTRKAKYKDIRTD